MGTINRGLQYVNYVNERAIRDPKWFWGDTEDAQQARAFLYNLKGGQDLVNEIYQNTPPEIQKTISYKKLPTNTGGAGTKKMNKSITDATNAVTPVIAGILPAPVALGQSLAAGALGTALGVGGSYLGSKVMGNWGRQIGTDLLAGNNRSYNYLDENGTPTVVGSWGQTGQNIGNVVGSIAGGMAGSALGEAIPSWAQAQTSYGRMLNNRRVGDLQNFTTGVLDSERGLLYGRPNGYSQKGNFMSRWTLRGNNGKFTYEDYALRSRNLSNPLGQKGNQLYGTGSHVTRDAGATFFPSTGFWSTSSGNYEPMGGLFMFGSFGEGTDNPTVMPDFRYPNYTPIDTNSPVDTSTDTPIVKRPSASTIQELPTEVNYAPSTGPNFEPISPISGISDPNNLELPESNIIGGAKDNPTIKDLQARNRDMRRAARGAVDNPETENNERRDARILARRDNKERRGQIRDMRKEIRGLRQNRDRILANGQYMQDQGIDTGYQDMVTDINSRIASIRGRRRKNENQITRSFNQVEKDLQ